MGRHPRIEVPAGSYHVTTRGNNQEPIVWDDRDRALFLITLSRTVRRHRWTLLAYCLMTNHYHLVLRLDRDGLSSAMCELNGGFARMMNLRHGRTGHLFERRFHDELVTTDRHLLEAIRYVVLNPVRAGLCERADQWKWSSHRACAGLDLPLPGLAVGEVLSLFGDRPERARRAYCTFVSEGHVQVPGTVTEV
jgi:REP-associated tyrosine transposase